MLPDSGKMSNGPIIQYIGFQAKPQTRQYAFNVREAGVEREFTLDIANEAFVSHRARYQDAPAICALRLHAELAAHSNHPPDTRFVITLQSSMLTKIRTHRRRRVAPPDGRRPKKISSPPLRISRSDSKGDVTQKQMRRIRPAKNGRNPNCCLRRTCLKPSFD